ncbi:MAG: hypothetical protein IPN11_11505 [Opitutaceae bacterium]|nr:hypothetical protein [Opitutaceae bacterium]
MRQLVCFALALGLTGPALRAADAATARARLDAAVAVLQSPAVGEEDSRRIRADLAALAAESPVTESGIAARYLLGRLRQIEEGIGEPPEFTSLLSEHPQHPLAQLAAVKVILRRLYAEGPETPGARLQAAEQLGRVVTLAALRCDFHQAMGDAYIFHGDRREPALRHLRAAEALGIPSAAARANVLVQIGELARLTGDGAVAGWSYRKFLADFPRDLRQQIVRDRLADSGGSAP